MSSLRPPSTSPSPSPAPNGSSKTNARASMGPSGRPAPINLVNPPASPRPGAGAGRPTSELLGGAGMFQTPEAEAIDQWFENLQNYEATLEEMAAASLDVNFKEELSAIEQWFRVLSEAERTAALYSLLQHSTQVQIRFFITVLQQMARADPMTALLSPNAGGSMQSQMEAKLAQLSLRSPGLKSNIPSSPSARNFSGNLTGNRQSLAVESSTSSSFLSPESAANAGNNDAAATLAQQRAKLKANAAHRISAPALAGASGNNVWGGSGASSLGQVAERAGDASPSVQELTIPAPGPPSTNGTRPKSTDFSGLLRSPRLATNDSEGLEAQLSPMVGGNWASMVNTPHDLMFDVHSAQNGGGQNLDAAATKLATWQMGNVGNSGGRFSLDDAKKFRRSSKSNGSEAGGNDVNNTVYGDDGNIISGGPPRNGRTQAGGNGLGWAGSAAMRSPALSNVSSGRFGSDDGGLAAMNMNPFGLGIPSPGLAGMGLNGMGGMNGMNGMLAQMGQLTPLQMQQLGLGMNMNMMNMANLGMPDAQAQLLAAQMAAGGFMQPGMAGGFGMGGLGPQGGGRGSAARGPTRMAGMGSSVGGAGRSNNGRSSGGAGDANKEKDEEVDPSLLGDVPGWLRSLRLHKYTPNFENMHWRDMVVMDEAALEAKGVAALGARRKMLKTFEAVRNKMGVEMPAAAGAAPTSG
ncbi:hypothetical protein DFH11DRAFT_1083327 [Phellopilus nigrolimitatus]|nr:hypothetical protein DFH11DRAFT_1083327 [Phellopilus nigrolimitatus]